MLLLEAPGVLELEDGVEVVSGRRMDLIRGAAGREALAAAGAEVGVGAGGGFLGRAYLTVSRLFASHHDGSSYAECRVWRTRRIRSEGDSLQFDPFLCGGVVFVLVPFVLLRDSGYERIGGVWVGEEGRQG